MPKISLKDKRILLEHLRQTLRIPDDVDKDQYVVESYSKMSQKQRARILTELKKR